MSSIRPSSLFNSTTSYNAAEVSFSSTKGGEFHRDATASSSSTHSTARIAGVKAVNKGSSSQQPWSMLSRHANSSREEIPPLRVETAKDRGGNHTPRVSATPKPSQSWSILTRHARDEILPIHLQQLCSDKDRVSSLVSVHSSTYRDVKRMILLDISRQRMNLDTINHLLRLAASLDLRGYIRRFSWGHNNPENPITREQIQNTTMLMKGATANSNWNSRYIGRVRTNSFQQQSATSSNNNNNLHEPSSFWGGAVATPLNPDGSHSMHMSLRAPRDDPTMAMFTADATNALEAIHEEWSRIELLTNTIRAGKLRGVSGQPLRDVVVVGRGVSVLGLKFVYNALRQNSEAIQASRKGVLDESMSTSWTKRAATAITNNISEACRRMRFVSCADPTLVQQAIEDLNPQSTIIVSVALRENEDTEVATRYLYGWLSRGLKGYKREHITSHHMFLVTGDELLKQVKPESTFLIPNHSRCEAFGTFTAATLLPLSIVFGWPIVEHFLAGAHDMDKHFVETNPRHNFPVLLALTDVWNDAFLGSSGRIVTPFSEQFASFASFVAVLESETCGRCFDKQGRKVAGSKTASAAVIQGSLQGEYDRMLYQGGRIFPSEMIATMQSPDTTAIEIGGSSSAGSRITAHDRMVCTLFAHADLLALGDNPVANRNSLHNNPSGTLLQSTSSVGLNTSSTDTQSQSEGNRPSTLILCSRCDAFTCGQLIALSEHRVVVSARIWDINPFLTESGSKLRETETERLQEKLQNLWVMGIDETDDDDKLDYAGEKSNFATSKVLALYASSRSVT